MDLQRLVSADQSVTMLEMPMFANGKWKWIISYLGRKEDLAESKKESNSGSTGVMIIPIGICIGVGRGTL
jgi:hypothetical protein